MEVREIIKTLIENAPNTYSGTDIELQQKKMFAFQNAVNEAQEYLKESEKPCANTLCEDCEHESCDVKELGLVAEEKKIEQKAEEYAEKLIKHKMANHDIFVKEKAKEEIMNVYIAGATEATKELQEDLDHKKIAIQTRKARIKQLEKEDELSRKRIEKYKKELKELRVAFIQAQAMALSGGKSLEDIIGQMKDITFGVSN